MCGWRTDYEPTTGGIRRTRYDPFDLLRRSGFGSIRHGNSFLNGLRLIMSSRYLCHLCVYLLANSFVSSMFYFIKAIVVADSHMGSSSRTAFFAGINSFSALITILLQVRNIFFLLSLQLCHSGDVMRICNPSPFPQLPDHPPSPPHPSITITATYSLPPPQPPLPTFIHTHAHSTLSPT